MKMYLVKAFVLSVLMYPTVPLHTASDNQMVKLQAVQNAALKFAYNRGWPDRTKARTHHGGTKYYTTEPTKYGPQSAKEEQET